MNIAKLKRRYLDLRTGGVTINPIIQASNFVMITYLVVDGTIPFWIYAPLFLVGVISAFTVSGFLFRKIQLSTDEDLKYEKQTQLNKTLYHIMCQQKQISNALKLETNEDFEKQMDFVRKISSNTVQTR